MVVATNDQAAVLSERARHALLEAGAVTDGPTVQLRDNVASVGDHIVTRRNNRTLQHHPRRLGGQRRRVDRHRRPPGWSSDVRCHADGAGVTLPADYLAAHAHLAYATTAHRAQGMTVDVCHAAVIAHTTHEQLYVAATRGRAGNHLWVIVDADRDIVRDREDLPAPEQILSRILERTDPDRLSAHQVIADSLRDSTSLARLGAIFKDAARTATDRWLRGFLTARGLGAAADDPQWPSLISRARDTALTGHDLVALVEEAIRMRPIDDAHSTAAVLHWRLGALSSTPARPRGPLASLPPTDGPAVEVARQVGELMRRRRRDLRAGLTATTEALPWAEALRPRGSSVPAEQTAWLDAATAVTAYRERYKVPDHTPLLGARPGVSRPDARAAWDHACLQADRYLARRLRDIDDQALADLDARQQAIVDNQPRFDPGELERARERLDAAGPTGDPGPRPANPEGLVVQRLELAAGERAEGLR